MSIDQGEDDMRKPPRRRFAKGRSCFPPRCDKNGASKQPCKRKSKPIPSLFTEQVFLNVSTTDDFVALPAQDTSNKATYSYAVVNRGSEPVIAQVEIGPNGSDYATDVEEIVPNGETAIVVPAKFQRYTRLLVKSMNAGKPTGITVYFQSQTVR